MGRAVGDQAKQDGKFQLKELGPQMPEKRRLWVGGPIALVKYLKSYHTEGVYSVALQRVTKDKWEAAGKQISTLLSACAS